MDDPATSRETVLEKIRSIEARIDGIVTAAESLAQVDVLQRDLVPALALAIPPMIDLLTKASQRALDDELKNAYRDAGEMAGAVRVVIGETHAEFKECVGKLHHVSDEFVAADDAVREHDNARLTEIHDSFDTTKADLDASFRGAGRFLETASEDIQQALRTRIADATQAYLASIESHLAVLLPQLQAQLHNVVTQTAHDFQTRTQQMGLEYSQRAQRAFDNVEHEAHVALTQALQGVVAQVRDTLIQRVTRQIADTIIETNLSVQISAAVTPVMPQLLVAYHGSEVLKDALRLFRGGGLL